jgi:hypothetical protein
MSIMSLMAGIRARATFWLVSPRTLDRRRPDATLDFFSRHDRPIGRVIVRWCGRDANAGIEILTKQPTELRLILHDKAAASIESPEGPRKREPEKKAEQGKGRRLDRKDGVEGHDVGGSLLHAWR